MTGAVSIEMGQFDMEANVSPSRSLLLRQPWKHFNESINGCIVQFVSQLTATIHSVAEFCSCCSIPVTDLERATIIIVMVCVSLLSA